MVGRRRVIGSVVALLTLLTGASPAGAEPAASSLQFASPRLVRGSQGTVRGSALAPDTIYRLSAPYGYFSALGAQVTTVESDDTGAFVVLYHLTTDVPAGMTSIEVTATAPDGTAVTATAAVLGPWLGRGGGRVCSGLPAPVTADGFPDGTYTLSSPDVTFNPNSVTPVNGSFATSGVYAVDLPGTITVTATAQDAPGTTYSFTWQRDEPLVRDHLSGETPWTTHYQATCFTPGETVTFASTDRRTQAPGPVKADSTGTVAFAVRSIASSSPSSPGGVIARGARSGQTTTTGPRFTYGYTLAAGGTIRGTTHMLISPHSGYVFAQNYCNVSIWRYWSDGGSSGQWFAPDKPSQVDTCLLTLRTDGNLVLTSAGHATIWSSYTYGTGAHNRLVMRDDGNAVLYNAAGHWVWSSATGIVRTPREIGEGQTLTRGQSLVNGHTRLTLGPYGNLVVVRYGHTVWRSNTAHRGVTHALLGYSGNLMLLTARGHLVWSSRTPDGGSRNYLIVQANGDVQIRNQFNDLPWHTRTGR